jgi:hypothetical protein
MCSPWSALSDHDYSAKSSRRTMHYLQTSMILPVLDMLDQLSKNALTYENSQDSRDNFCYNVHNMIQISKWKSSILDREVDNLLNAVPNLSQLFRGCVVSEVLAVASELGSEHRLNASGLQISVPGPRRIAKRLYESISAEIGDMVFLLDPRETGKLAIQHRRTLEDMIAKCTERLVMESVPLDSILRIVFCPPEVPATGASETSRQSHFRPRSTAPHTPDESTSLTPSRTFDKPNTPSHDVSSDQPDQSVPAQHRESTYTQYSHPKQDSKRHDSRRRSSDQRINSIQRTHDGQDLPSFRGRSRFNQPEEWGHAEENRDQVRDLPLSPPSTEKDKDRTSTDPTKTGSTSARASAFVPKGTTGSIQSSLPFEPTGW